MSEVTSDAASPYTENIWEPSTSDLKSYRHFDAVIGPSSISSLVRDPLKVASHSFRPLLHFEKKWRRPPKNGVARDPKIRPIRYACRKDAYIYKHYRGLLSNAYEHELIENDLASNILAYRRIAVSAGAPACKSNIHFAKDVFDLIDTMDTCCAIALDISDFFGSIDHDRLKQRWMRLLKCERLPNDHFSVFRSVTDYKFIDINDAFVALGYSQRDSNGQLSYLINPKEIPIQLCSPSDYRSKLIGAGLVQHHGKDFGIPQGTPLSDLLANAYLLEFDIAMKTFAEERSGHYFRYSDDILLLLPTDEGSVFSAYRKAASEMAKMGPKLRVNPSKTEITVFTCSSGPTRCRNFELDASGVPVVLCDKHGNQIGNAGFSYLGFRYDGQQVFLRDSTLSNLQGKIARTCKSEAFFFVNRHFEKDLSWVLANAPVDQLKQRYMDVENFEETVAEARQCGNDIFSKMTFWSYARRASKLFGTTGRPILRQLRGIGEMIDRQYERELRAKYALLH